MVWAQSQFGFLFRRIISCSVALEIKAPVYRIRSCGYKPQQRAHQFLNLSINQHTVSFNYKFFLTMNPRILAKILVGIHQVIFVKISPKLLRWFLQRCFLEFLEILQKFLLRFLQRFLQGIALEISLGFPSRISPGSLL